MSVELLQSAQLSSPALHSAFTDIVKVNQFLLVCYRQATNHVSGDGVIETVLLDSDMRVICRQKLSLPNIDLRDPKLSIMPDGRVLLIAYARHRDNNNKTFFTQSMRWFSNDGTYWSSPRYFGPKNWWLWRVRWHGNLAYGLAYNRRANRVDLYKGNPMRSMECVKEGVLSLTKHGRGYPNESDICFDKTGAMYALVRRDADSFSAMWGVSTPPYTRWCWHDLQTYIGGPTMLPIGDDKLLISGRLFKKSEPKTALWEWHTKTLKLSLLQVLPSAGDNSYPGLIKWRDNLFLSYYSMHIDWQSRVYLAKLRLGDEIEQ